MRLKLTPKQWAKLPASCTVYNSGAAHLQVMATDDAFTGTEVDADWDTLTFNKGERFAISAGGLNNADVQDLAWFVHTPHSGYVDVSTRIHVGDESGANRIVCHHGCRIPLS